MKKTLFKSKANRNEHIFCFCMLIFFVLHWFVFWVYANFNSIRMAFTEYNDVTFTHDLLPSGRTFENFKKFFTEIFSARGAKYLLNGAYFHLISTVFCLPLIYMVAYIIYKKLPATGFFKVVLYLPAIVSGMVTVLLYKHIIESGLDGFMMQNLGKKLPYVFTDERYSRLTISAYVIFFGIPGSLLINLGTMSRVPEELIEYGQMEGITLFKEFLHVIVPLIYPVLEVQCLGLFLGFFTTSGPLYTFYQYAAPENLKTFGYYMFVSVLHGTSEQAAEFSYGYNAAAHLSIGLFSVPIVQATKWLLDKFDPQAEY